eukprot:scaffold34638_cov161-Amphora_coffeaeformis.AAC.4
MLAATRLLTRRVALRTRVVVPHVPAVVALWQQPQRCGFAGGGGKDDHDDDMDLEAIVTGDVPLDKGLGGENSLLAETRRQARINTKERPKFRKKDLEEKDDLLEPLRLRSKKKPSKISFETEDPLLKLLEVEDDIEGLEEVEMPEIDVEKLRAERKEEMNHKTGRGWTDPWDLDPILASNERFEDLPDWSPEFVSRISQERVRILEDGIPTLEQLARLPLPPLPHPHPGHGHTKAYALHRFRHLHNQIAVKVEALAAPRIPSIQALPTWEDKQDAVDELFERIEFTLQEQEPILGKHPQFGYWVEKALENYLKSMQRKKEQNDAAKEKAKNEATEASDDDKGTGGETAQVEEETSNFPTKRQDEEALPLFMDCFVADQDSEEENIPKILHPLAPLERGANQGRMYEEWSLAAHKTTKRILLRQPTRSIAQFMETHPVARIFVTGRKGTGKTATLLSLVAAARKSGHIVLFMPHSSMLAEFGFYIEPSDHRPGMFDLPVLSAQLCKDLETSHKEDLASIPVDQATLEVFFSPDQLRKAFNDGTDSLSVADLVSVGSEKRAVAPMCYSAAIDTLMKQDAKPFTMVVDEFNTFFASGRYFHEDYDKTVRKAIPYNRINLFQPMVDAMGLLASETELLPDPVLMKRGAIIAGMSYSKPVLKRVNAGLEISAKELAAATDSNMFVADIPRLTNLEVDHVMANYEAIGYGKLRMDQGETVTNAQEVAYLRAISSNNPQELMNACLID